MHTRIGFQTILVLLQIFGRAGRPQFDKSGEATLITTHDALARYLDKLVRDVPIESTFIKQLADHLNAEVVGGTVTTIEEADYIRFFSERYGKSFIAWQVEPSVNVPNQQSIGFEMVRRAEETQFLFEAVRTYRGDFGGDALSTDNLTPDQQDRIAELGYTLPGSEARADDEIERLDRWLRDQESFFFQLVQLQQQYGVRSYLGF